MAILRTRSHGTKGAEIAKNSLVAVKNRLVAIKSGFADLAVVGDKIVGISKQDKTFDADNQTVMQEKLTYYGLDENSEFDEIVTNGTITQADVHKTYNLVAGGTSIDGATGATWTQAKLIKVISSTEGRFIAV